MAEVKQQEYSSAAMLSAEDDTFSALINKAFDPKTEQAQTEVEKSVKALAEQALANTTLISSDAITNIKSMIAMLDKQLSEQVNLILHHQDFQALESSWRGLRYLVSNTQTDEMLKIKILNISKKDLAKNLEQFTGVEWDQSPVFKKVYEEQYGQYGGKPFGCLMGDYYFDHSPADVALLREMAQISAAAHAPFITAPSPTLLNMNSWQELSDPRDITKIFQTPAYAAWRDLRNTEDSRYIGLAMPRFLGRLPYGATTNPVEDFAFEEEVKGTHHKSYLWVNAAYAMACNINRAFKDYGWCSRIRGVESGGLVENLPVHTFPTDDGGVDMKCPTEIAISDRREAELAKNGLMPLMHRKNENSAVFLGAQSLQNPVEYDTPDATANAYLSARLSYLFASCRFAHYLKQIARDKIGSIKERAALEAWLNRWVLNYVEPSPANASQEDLARKPLADAKVVVEDVAGNPGYYTSKIFLRPHYQLEGLKVSLRLVSKIEK